jgi:hypothetical protein
MLLLVLAPAASPAPAAAAVTRRHLSLLWLPRLAAATAEAWRAAGTAPLLLLLLLMMAAAAASPHQVVQDHTGCLQQHRQCTGCKSKISTIHKC